jgi:DNA repair protein SbcC/Rad50
MRPITLDMHGFASFRDEAHVDFTDADFFALVGPTGSGKSTVIDAMTFALYGSVPRWGRKGMVSLALAPTVARGTVKLVFEVDRQRYVVARELRRTGAAVNQRAASLERLADQAGLAMPGDQTFPLAKDLDGVNEAVEKLLGLRYDDFVQCVVLPQGQFAAFLHAKPTERQDILLRLLGAEHYRHMMMKANSRDKEAALRAGTYGEELLGYADATAEAEHAARAAEAGLAGLRDRVQAALPLIAARRDELADADSRLDQLRAEGAALAALRVPDGVGQLDADLARSRARVTELRAAEQAAEQADGAARDELARGPQRAPLDRAREHRAEHARLQAAIGGLAADVTECGARAGEASAAVDTAASALDAARAARDDAARAAQAAAERVTALNAEHARLAAVSVPAGTAELDERRAAAAAAVTVAAHALEEAEREDVAARTARAAAPQEAALAQASRDLAELRAILHDITLAGREAQRAAVAREAAEATLAAAEQAFLERQADLERARRAHVVAGLRPHLVTGESCPVCEQTITTLPPPLPADKVDAAQARLAEADRALAAARPAAHQAGIVAGKIDAGLDASEKRQVSVGKDLAGLLSGPLAPFPLATARAAATAHATADVRRRGGRAGTADGPGPDAEDEDREDALTAALAEVAALSQARGQAEQAADRADAAAQQARARHRTALAAAEKAEAELSNARAALRTARDPLVELGAPSVDGTGLADGWTALTQWAKEQARVRSAALEAARDTAAAATAHHTRLAAGYSAAERDLARLRAAAKAASEDDQRARAALSQVTVRVAELGELLKDAPDDEQITERLAHLTRLEAVAAAAERALRAVRAERSQAEAAHAALENAERAARGQLSDARDRVVALGAPAFGDRGLLDDWTHLVTWASGEAKLRDQAAEEAEREAGAARSGIAELTARLSADLAGAGIDLAPEAVAASAATAVAGALEAARAVTRRVAERRARVAELAGKQRTAQEDQQVAHLLGNLLQARQFPQWLVSAALDDLVATASQTLAALSGGQFDLTHDKGDLFVIDHADADTTRSVRTLSGGETFQASLALALALSSHISALAAAGAARLDSIFLDEGFGTLDPETLEVVAATLEALAQGDRMVGVVTHVSALAERVPVRFLVARNARTSVITREGLPRGEAGEP